MDNPLKNKVIIVVGAGGLLGQKFANEIAHKGGTVIAASRKVSSDFFDYDDKISKNERIRIHFASVDVTVSESVEKLFDTVAEKHKHIDAIVNSSFPHNAGFGTKFENVTYENFCDNIGKHIGGCFLLCQKAAAFFEQQGYGNIVNLSSIYGIIAPRFEIYEGTSMTKEVEYIVSKSAIIHLTKYLAKYLKGKNIRVNCLSPGGVLDGQPEKFTDNYNAQSLNKGMLSTNDVVGTLIYLLSGQSKYVNGQNIVVDDGFSL